MSHAVTSYGEEVRRCLAFDRRAAARLAAEAEAHLYDSIADDPDGGEEAAVRAIRRFGDPREMAAAYVRALFPGRLKLAWRLTVLPLLLMAGAMWLRRMFELRDGVEALPGGRLLLDADAIGFRAALLLALLAAALSKVERWPALLMQALIAGTSALGISAGAGLVIAFGAVGAGGWSRETALPTVAAAAACALLLLLLNRLRMLARYAELIGRGGCH